MPTFERQLIGLAVAACFAGIVHANPTGPAVAHGGASFATSGNTLTVTNTPGAIINWQAFSIRPDEVTRFVQSGAASAVLNRVTGPGQSAILGQLLSNGRVFLINPNGVVVGAGARIDTAGFVASSLNLSNEDFLAGRFRFTDPGNAGKVTNAGSIHAHSGGPVYLIAPTVENHGVITAPNGDITLAAGKSVELVSAGSPHLRVEIQAGGEAVNVGRLLADSGRVGLYGAAIRNAGTVSADSASVNAAGNVVLKASRDVTLESTSVVSASGGKGGSVEIQADQGTLLAEGRVAATGAVDQGGEVKLLGTQVGLVGSAAVDASGRTGGGTVLVGGDYQGKNAEVQNAQASFVGADATIRADAAETGDGGRIIVWADGATRFAGAASARGGAAGGDGGFVEVSGKDWLAFTGRVDTTAALGQTGMLLLDPTNITISTGATSSGTCPALGPCFALTGAPATAVLNVTDLLNALANTNVNVNTASAAASAGDITLSAAIAYTGGAPRTLALTANRDITLNAGVSSTGGALSVDLNAGRNIANNGNDIATSGGNVSMTAGTGTITNLGTLTAGAGTVTLTANGNITQNGTDVIASTSNLIKQGAGTLTLNRPNTYTGATTINAGTVSVTNATGLGTAAGGTTVAAGATLAINGTVTVADALALNGTGVGGAGALQRSGGTPTVSGAVTLATDTSIGGATGTLNVTGVLGGAGNLTKIGAGTVTLGANNAAYNGTVTVNAGTLTVNNANALGSAVGGTTVNAGGTLALNNFTIAGEPLTLNGGTLSRAAGNPTWNGTVNLASTSTVTGTTGTLTIGGIVSGPGGLTKTGAGAVTLSGNNTYGGTTTLNGGTITVNNANALGAAAAGTTVNAGATLALNNFTIASEPLTLNGGALSRAAGNPTWNGPVNLASNSTVTGGGGTLTIGGVVSGTGNLSKAGAGTVTLSGANTYSGTATVNAGTLTLGANDVLPDASAVVVNGGTLSVNTRTDTVAGVQLLSGSITGTTGVLTSTSDYDVRSGTVSARLGGGAGLNKTTAGTVTLSGTNTYTGATTVSAGTLTAGANNVLANGSSLIVNGGTYNLNTRTDTVAGVQLLSGSITGTTGVLTSTSAYDLQSGTVSARLGGGVGLNKTTAGTVTLSGTNTYTGTTTVTAGTLVAANAAALGSTAGGTTVATGATLDVNNVAVGAEAVTINGNGVGGAGALTGTGAAALGGTVTVASASRVGAAAGNSLALNGAVQGPGALDVAGGTITFGSTVGNVTPLAAITSTAGTTLNVNGGLVRTTGTQTYNGTVTTGGPTTLQTTNSSVAAAGAVTATAGTLTLNTGTGSVTLTNAANDFVTVTIPSGGTVSLVDQNGFALGASSVGSLQAQTLAGNLTLNGAVTASSAGDSIVLAAAGNFVNNAGAGALVVPGTGRWVVYSTDPAANTFGGLASGNQAIWNATVAGSPPASIPGGNRYVFSMTGSPATLTFTSTDAAKVYGDVADVSGNYMVSGFVNAATYGSVFTQDTAANAFTGAPSVTSAGTPAPANAGLYPITVTVGSLSSGTGYVLAFNSAGQLTVSPRPITLTAGSAARLYGDPNPVPAPLYAVGGSGMANLEDAQTLFGFTVGSGAVGATPVGVYAAGVNAYNIAGVGIGANGNYNITAINPGTLTISPAPLTVTANNAARPEAQPNPPFSATYAGFKNGETPAALGGALAFTTPATIGSPPGGYTITPFGQTATNYTISYVDGVLTVTPLPVVPVVPVPPVVSGVAAADNALITATQRSADAEVAPRLPDANSVDCLELERAGVRRVLTRCF